MTRARILLFFVQHYYCYCFPEPGLYVVVVGVAGVNVNAVHLFFFFFFFSVAIISWSGSQPASDLEAPSSPRSRLARSVTWLLHWLTGWLLMNNEVGCGGSSSVLSAAWQTLLLYCAGTAALFIDLTEHFVIPELRNRNGYLVQKRQSSDF